jgi:hypothetical protein
MSRFGSNGIANKLGPYMYADGALRKLTLKRDGDGDRHFTLLISGAYNAMGLIGSEYNGIVVLDDDHLQVVLDQHMKADSGYYGPTNKQIDEWERILKMNYDEFIKLCREHPRTRTPNLE